MHELIERIRKGQQHLPPVQVAHAPEKKAHKVVIACVDARKQPDHMKDVLGEEFDLIRTIAAQVNGDGDDKERAMLEQMIKDGVTEIDILGHSRCGGVAYCMHKHDTDDSALAHYTRQLDDIRDRILDEGHTGEVALRKLEIESILNTVAKLRSHPVVDEAVKDGKLKIRGLMLNTGSPDHEVIEITAGQTKFNHEGEAPLHQPKMLIIAPKDGKLMPQSDIILEDGQPLGDGKALIYRNADGTVQGTRAGTNISEAAIMEFACKHMGVEDIVLLALKDESRIEEQKHAMKESLQHIQDYEAVRAALQCDAHVHAYLLDKNTKQLELVQTLDMSSARSAASLPRQGGGYTL